MADESLSLEQSVLDAVTKNPPPVDKELEEIQQAHGTKSESKPPKEDEKPKEEKPKEEDKKSEEDDTLEIDASQEEIQNGLTLLRALADPKQRAELVKSIAEQTGLEVKTKEQKAEVEDLIVAALKEELGDNYDLLQGDKFAKAFKKIITQEVTKQTKHIDAKLAEDEKKANETKANQAIDALWDRQGIKDPKQREAIAKEMDAKMRRMPPDPNTPLNEYLDDIFTLVNRDNKQVKEIKRTVEKIRKNADEHISSGEGSGNDQRFKTGSGKASLDEAVRAAVKGQKLE